MPAPLTRPRPHATRWLAPRVVLSAILLCAVPSPSLAAPAEPPSTQANGSLAHEVREAIARGTGWLERTQGESGAWSDARHPALSALPLLVLTRAGAARVPGVRNREAVLEKGFHFLRTQTKPDGGIYSDSLSNYNTAISVLALLQYGKPADSAILANARRFLVGQQATQMVRPELDGGIGYGPTGVSPKRQHPDLDNTLVTLEALRALDARTAAAEPDKTNPPLDWAAAIAFVSRCQNLPQSNQSDWVSGAPADRGGFVYYPGFSNAGETQDAGGKTALRSSGTMSYAGLLSFIYAELSAQDPRVQAAREWLEKHYTLEENPGLGRQGLFYYYHLMAKALSLSGVTELNVPGGKRPWARELALRLLNAQNADGSWVNDTGRWMEKDPVLVSSYSLLALLQVCERL